MTVPTVDEELGSLVWFLAYAGPNLKLANLESRIGGQVCGQKTVFVHDAWLSFDFRGLPYVEPCYASLLIKNYNDGGWRGSRPSIDNGDGKLDESDKEIYARYVYERCCPGVPWQEGAKLPPFVEGVAYQITKKQYQRLIATEGWDQQDSPNGYRTVTVSCNVFKDGDSTQVSGTLLAKTLIAREECRKGGLQPSFRYFRPLVLSALQTPLSQPYVGHLLLLKPYTPPRLSRQYLASLLLAALLLPPFLFIFVPAYTIVSWEPAVKQRIGFVEVFQVEDVTRRIVSWLVYWVWILAGVFEARLGRHVLGSGYRIKGW